MDSIESNVKCTDNQLPIFDVDGKLLYRGLFEKEPIVPQFNLFLACNRLPHIQDNINVHSNTESISINEDRIYPSENTQVTNISNI